MPSEDKLIPNCVSIAAASNFPLSFFDPGLSFPARILEAFAASLELAEVFKAAKSEMALVVTAVLSTGETNRASATSRSDEDDLFDVFAEPGGSSKYDKLTGAELDATPFSSECCYSSFVLHLPALITSCTLIGGSAEPVPELHIASSVTSREEGLPHRDLA